jgi:hypothetical protein
MKKFVPWVAASIAAVVAVGCAGSDTIITGQSPRVRALNAVFNQDVLVRFTESPEDNRTLSYGNITDYAIVDNTNQRVTFVDPPSGDIFATESGLFRNNTFYTVVGAGGIVDERAAFAFEDRQDDPSNDSIDYRIVNAAKDADIGVVDVFVVGVGESIEGKTATFTNVQYKAATDYLNKAPGDVDVVVRDNGTGTILARKTLSLETNETYSIFLLVGDKTAGEETVRVFAKKDGPGEETTD